jgi:CPA1 family monovalent cation:H+ antiporter
MDNHMTETMQTIAALLVAGIGYQWLAWRLRIPAILFLLMTGVLAGPLLGWLRPDMLFGDLFFPFVSLSVALILFEGGLTLEFHQILSVLVYEVILAGVDASMGHTFLTLGKMVLIGLTLGLATGQLAGELMRRHWLPDYLHNVYTLSMVCGLFAISDLLQAESGLLAVTVMGMRLANMKNVNADQLLNFKESISVLLISLLFILLAVRLQPDTLFQLGWAGLAVLVAVQFMARPISVTLSTLGTQLPLRERQLLAWIAPRGIVAAAVSSLFALRLEQMGHPEAGFLVPLTFMVIIGTVILQGLTSAPLARALGVAEAIPKGVLIVGAAPVARALALVLRDCGFRPRLVDTNWEDISQSRMEGLHNYYGNPLSDHAHRDIDLIGVGAMLAVTPNAEQNTLAALHYWLEIGRDAVYAVRTEQKKKATERRETSIS